MCIYLHEDISAQMVYSASSQSVEALMIKVKELHSLFFVVYRPGGVKGTGFQYNLEELSSTIDMCQSNGQYPNINGFGDYNFPDQRWSTGVLPSPLLSISLESTQFNHLPTFMRRHLLFQIV